jgi:cytochrome c oxidase subunit 3
MSLGVEERAQAIASDLVSGGSSGGRFPGGRRSDGPEPFDVPKPMGPASEKSRILTALILLVVGMTFAGLFAAYIVIATNNVLEWRPFDLPYQVWLSTILILLSSVTYHFGKIAVDRRQFGLARKWMFATTALSGIFIASQLIVWVQLRSLGFYMEGNPYTGFFYILTVMHAIHVIGGIIALGIVFLSLEPASHSEAKAAWTASLANVVGWYWHFMGAIWIVMLALLGFWQ